MKALPSKCVLCAPLAGILGWQKESLTHTEKLPGSRPGSERSTSQEQQTVCSEEYQSRDINAWEGPQTTAATPCCDAGHRWGSKHASVVLFSLWYRIHIIYYTYICIHIYIYIFLIWIYSIVPNSQVMPICLNDLFSLKGFFRPPIYDAPECQCVCRVLCWFLLSIPHFFFTFLGLCLMMSDPICSILQCAR